MKYLSMFKVLQNLFGIIYVVFVLILTIAEITNTIVIKALQTCLWVKVSLDSLKRKQVLKKFLNINMYYNVLNYPDELNPNLNYVII